MQERLAAVQERLAVVQERLAVVQEAGGGRARASGYDDSRRGKRPRVERTRPFRDKASRRKWRGQRLLGNRASHRPHAHRQWMECARAFGEGTRAFGEGTRAFGEGTRAFGEGTRAFGEGAHASGERARAVAGSASACTRMRMCRSPPPWGHRSPGSWGQVMARRPRRSLP